MSNESAASLKPLTLRLETRIDDCGVDSWASATANAPLFMQQPFLSALEAAMPEAIRPKYVIFTDNEKLVAVAVGQLLSLHADRIPAAESMRSTLLQSVAAKFKIRVFLWGNFLGWGYSGVAFAPGVDRVAYWPLLAEAISRAHQCDKDIASASLELVLDISESELDGARCLESYRFNSMQAEPNMILTIDPKWRSFDDYRWALKSKYRKASIEMDSALASAGCVVENISDVEKLADRLIALHLQVHEQSMHRFVTLRRDFIPALARNLGDRFICTAVRQGDHILGFITTLIDGDTAHAYVIGHDVAANRELPIYLRLLQCAVELGISRGCKRVTYGRTALEPKARVGAIPVSLTIFGRHKNRVVGPLVNRVLQQMAPRDGPPLRNPFKSSPG